MLSGESTSRIVFRAVLIVVTVVIALYVSTCCASR